MFSHKLSSRLMLEASGRQPIAPSNAAWCQAAFRSAVHSSLPEWSNDHSTANLQVAGRTQSLPAGELLAGRQSTLPATMGVTVNPNNGRPHPGNCREQSLSEPSLPLVSRLQSMLPATSAFSSSSARHHSSAASPSSGSQSGSRRDDASRAMAERLQARKAAAKQTRLLMQAVEERARKLQEAKDQQQQQPPEHLQHLQHLQHLHDRQHSQQNAQQDSNATNPSDWVSNARRAWGVVMQEVKKMQEEAERQSAAPPGGAATPPSSRTPYHHTSSSTQVDPSVKIARNVTATIAYAPEEVR